LQFERIWIEEDDALLAKIEHFFWNANHNSMP